jgi:hypothetical protein
MGRAKSVLTDVLVLSWADAHFARTGRWPRILDPDTMSLPPGLTWQRIDLALRQGHRGLPGGDSLPRLLARDRGARVRRRPPPLSEGRLVAWARAHRRVTGRWPVAASGPVAAAPGESWAGIDTALRHGLRGLSGGDSLARLLARRLGARTRVVLLRLTERLVLAWADEHHRRTGRWPTSASGPVVSAAGERWGALNQALRLGLRGLPGGDSLSRLLRRNGRGGRVGVTRAPGKLTAPRQGPHRRQTAGARRGAPRRAARGQRPGCRQLPPAGAARGRAGNDAATIIAGARTTTSARLRARAATK